MEWEHWTLYIVSLYILLIDLYYLTNESVVYFRKYIIWRTRKGYLTYSYAVNDLFFSFMLTQCLKYIPNGRLNANIFLLRIFLPVFRTLFRWLFPFRACKDSATKIAVFLSILYTVECWLWNISLYSYTCCGINDGYLPFPR